MSGGGIDYAQFKILQIIEDVKRAHEQRSKYEELSPNTIKELQYFLTLLQITQVYAERFDYLYEGDDSEETFHSRLSEDISNVDDAVDSNTLCKKKRVKMKFKTPTRMEFKI